jgi:hypothetical protein
MTASREAGPKAACSQLFTERYGEFIFGNDTVTALAAIGMLPTRSQQRLAALTGESPLAGAAALALVLAAPDKNLVGD